MKNVSIILIALISLASCKKEDVVCNGEYNYYFSGIGNSKIMVQGDSISSVNVTTHNIYGVFGEVKQIGYFVKVEKCGN